MARGSTPYSVSILLRYGWTILSVFLLLFVLVAVGGPELQIHLKGFFSDWEPVITSVAAIIAAFFGVVATLAALRTYRHSEEEPMKETKLSQIASLSELHERFFGTDYFHPIRAALHARSNSSPELENLRKIMKSDEDPPLQQKFIDYLNFFEWIAAQRTQDQLESNDITELFEYYVPNHATHNFVIRFLRKWCFDNLKSLFVNHYPAVFVYGTLRSSHAAHKDLGIIGKNSHSGVASAPGTLYQVSENYPGAVFGPDAQGKVVGEVWILRKPATTLDELDEYEEASPRCRRKRALLARKLIQIEMSQEKDARGDPLKRWASAYHDARPIEPGKIPTIEC